MGPPPYNNITEFQQLSEIILCLFLGKELTYHYILEKEMATHSSILAWRVPWTEEPGGLLSIGSHRVGQDWSDLACKHALEKKMATHSSLLAWRIPGTEEPGGMLSMGSRRVGHDWSDLAPAAAALYYTSTTWREKTWAKIQLALQSERLFPCQKAPP